MSLGDSDGESYAPHSPKNLFPKAAEQMNFDARELNVVGHWASSSKMPDRYDRSVCDTEMLMRNAIIPKAVDG